MPLMNGKDKNGAYYKYGKTGKKYYYQQGNKLSRSLAKSRAMKQARAINISKRKKIVN